MTGDFKDLLELEEGDFKGLGLVDGKGKFTLLRLKITSPSEPKAEAAEGKDLRPSFAKVLNVLLGVLVLATESNLPLVSTGEANLLFTTLDLTVVLLGVNSNFKPTADNFPLPSEEVRPLGLMLLGVTFPFESGVVLPLEDLELQTEALLTGFATVLSLAK